MLSLSIVPESTELIIAIIDESTYKYESIKFNKTKTNMLCLYDVFNSLDTLIREKNPDRVFILTSEVSNYGKVSFMRVKSEGLVELLCAMRQIDCVVYTKRKLRNFYNKYPEFPKPHYSEPIKPQKIRDALALPYLG